MAEINLLFLGDVVGSSGRKVIEKWVSELRRTKSLDLVVANAENAAHGFGLTPSIAEEMFRSGVDVLTGGNHSWDKKEIHQAFEMYPDRILRPANYPPGSAGRGSTVVTGKSGNKIAILNPMGRIFMDPLDCPFQAFKREAPALKQQTPILFVDLHAEATSEKQAMAFFADGEASALTGTHTHVQTADERILPKG